MQQLSDFVFNITSSIATITQRNKDIFKNVQVIDQAEILKDKADMLISHFWRSGAIKGGDIFVLKKVVALKSCIKEANNID